MLEELKIHPRGSYNAVIERLRETITDEGELSAETLQNIEHALKDVKQAGFFLQNKSRKD